MRLTTSVKGKSYKEVMEGSNVQVMDTQILCSSNVLTGRNLEQRRALVALLDPTMDLTLQTLEPYVDLSPLNLFTIEQWTEKEKRFENLLESAKRVRAECFGQCASTKVFRSKLLLPAYDI